MDPGEERLQVLKMVEAGKITAEEATRLLEAVDSDAAKGRDDDARDPRWLRVRVTGSHGEKVNVNVPLGLIDVALRYIPEQALQVGGRRLDVQEIMRQVREGAHGKLVEIKGDDDDTVEIYVE